MGLVLGGMKILISSRSDDLRSCWGISLGSLQRINFNNFNVFATFS